MRNLKMSFHSHADKTPFHKKGFARGLALKKRHKSTRKWLISIDKSSREHGKLRTQLATQPIKTALNLYKNSNDKILRY